MVSGAINALRQKSGAVSHCVNATMIRRSAVTASRENGEEISQEAADLMGHMKSTADKVYHVREREKNALYAAARMGTLMRQTETKEQKIVSDVQDSCDAVAKRKRWSKKENEAVQKVFAGKLEF